jgi:hypothetical protein
MGDDIFMYDKLELISCVMPIDEACNFVSWFHQTIRLCIATHTTDVMIGNYGNFDVSISVKKKEVKHER